MVSIHLKNISQIGSFPRLGVKIKNIWNHHLVIISQSVVMHSETSPLKLDDEKLKSNRPWLNDILHLWTMNLWACNLFKGLYEPNKGIQSLLASHFELPPFPPSAPHGLSSFCLATQKGQMLKLIYTVSNHPKRIDLSTVTLTLINLSSVVSFQGRVQSQDGIFYLFGWL